MIRLSRALQWFRDEQPPRRVLAARRQLLLRLVCRVSSPGPRGRGAGVQNGEEDGSRWSPPACGRRFLGIVLVFLSPPGCIREGGRGLSRAP